MDFEFIVCDFSVGIEIGVLMVFYFVDEVIIIINLEVFLVCDFDCILGILVLKLCCVENGEEFIKEYLLLMCYNLGCVSRGDMLSMEDVLEILCIKFVGVILED